MSGNLDTAFTNAWFGPFKVANVFPVGERRHKKRHRLPGFAYNEGPMDGPLEASIHAQSFAQIPLVNLSAQRSPIGMGARKFCPPGTTPIPNGSGETQCAPYSLPSQMVGAAPFNTVSSMAPSGFPASRTFPVGPYWAFKKE